MNRTVFSLPEQSRYTTRGGLAVQRVVEHFSGASISVGSLDGHGRGGVYLAP